MNNNNEIPYLYSFKHDLIIIIIIIVIFTKTLKSYKNSFFDKIMKFTSIICI